LLGVLTLVFVLARLTGDPALVMLPPDASPAMIENFRRIHGLDRPLVVQYQRFLLGALKGDFGQSLQFRTPAVALVLERMPATFQLAGAAWLFATIVGIPVGILAAANRNAVFDNLAKTAALLGQAVPAFWLGIMLIMLFAVRWRVLPSSGSGGIGYLVLPALCLAAGSSAVLIRLTRSSLLEEMAKDYLRTARAKGLTERVVIVHHALNNALIPILTIMGLQLTGLLSGAVVVETVFAWPGIGLLAVQSISFRDYPVVLATVFAAGCVYILGNIAIDVLYAVVDPRVRYG
jgi:peptide/nickel transport system permease protein